MGGGGTAHKLRPDMRSNSNAGLKTARACASCALSSIFWSSKKSMLPLLFLLCSRFWLDMAQGWVRTSFRIWQTFCGWVQASRTQFAQFSELLCGCWPQPCHNIFKHAQTEGVRQKCWKMATFWCRTELACVSDLELWPAGRAPAQQMPARSSERGLHVVERPGSEARPHQSCPRCWRPAFSTSFRTKLAGIPFQGCHL